MVKHILFYLMVSASVFGLSRGQEKNWGDLLRKDGDPEYEDKGVVERASGKTDTDDDELSVKKIREFIGRMGLKKFIPEDEKQEELEEGLEGDIGGGEPMDIYRVGNGSRCIVWNYDIFGFNGGRTREIADLIASKGFTVLIPDYYRGEAAKKHKLDRHLGLFVRKHSHWGKLKKDWENVVLPYAEDHGCTTIGAIGTCWGSYMVVRMSSHPLISAGVSMYPSHSTVIKVMKENEKDILAQIQDGSKQLFLPSAQDHKNVRPGGIGETVLGSRLKIVEFPDMKHGWTTRGDISGEEVKRDVGKAIKRAVEHFETHLTLTEEKMETKLAYTLSKMHL